MAAQQYLEVHSGLLLGKGQLEYADDIKDIVFPEWPQVARTVMERIRIPVLGSGMNDLTFSLSSFPHLTELAKSHDFYKVEQIRVFFFPVVRIIGDVAVSFEKQPTLYTGISGGRLPATGVMYFYSCQNPVITGTLEGCFRSFEPHPIGEWHSTSDVGIPHSGIEAFVYGPTDFHTWASDVTMVVSYRRDEVTVERSSIEASVEDKAG